MIKYICKKCNDLETETSICPVCGNRTELLTSEIYYCDHCNAPSFTEECSECHAKCKKIGSDLRPVFAKERLLLEIFLNKPMAYAGKAVWASSSNFYWVDGEKVKVNLADFRKQDPNVIIEKMEELKAENAIYEEIDEDNEHINQFVKLNHYRLSSITDEACNYIKNISKDFDLSSMFVSFSGGKDSTVTSSLVMKALGNEKIMHIYGDTTLEYPTSKEYIEKFRKKYPTTPMLVAKNKDQDFNNLCEVVGPPSRVMRWCCTVFKTGSITKKIEQLFNDKNRILSFQGIRRAESISRSKYDRESSDSKILKQVSASPIIDWLDFDVWLYILSNKIPFNSAYKQGFSRVGCWCCPNNSLWSEFLSSIFMPEEYRRWKELLYSFAKRVGKEDWKEYVDSGNWKARQGGNGLEYSKNAVVSFKPCVLEDNAYNFDLSRPISEELYVLFKPFGLLNFEIGNKRLNEVYVLDRPDGMPLLKLSGRIGSTTLKITVLKKNNRFVNSKTSEQLLNDQITKYQTCIACGYCQSVCRFNALKVVNLNKGNVSNNTVKYTINEDLCVGCIECVKHFDGGCYMKKVLRVKIGDQ